MLYRSLGNTGLTVSAVGFGTEYLFGQPQAHVVETIHAAIEAGINYFDLFFAQPEFRDNHSEAFLGKRDRLLLGAHLGATWHDGQGDVSRDNAVCEEFFHDFLTRYHTDYVDVLFLHNCDKPEDFNALTRPGGPLDLALQYKQQGKARCIGFGGHTVETALRAVRTGQVEVLLFPVNLACHALPGREALFQECASRGIGVVAMKPFAGGKLLEAGTRMAVNRFQIADDDRELEKPAGITPVQCLAYALSRVPVATVVPGCKDRQELAQALAILTASEADSDFATVLAAFRHCVTGECVYCNHCLPCPAAIDIGQTIRFLETRQGDPVLAARAADCLACGQCTDRCPFGVDPQAKILEAAAGR